MIFFKKLKFDKKKELVTSGCKIINDKKSKWLQSNIKMESMV